MVGSTISHYRILEELGAGGMGVVYKAQDLSLDRTVALKFLPRHLTADGGERERLIHEARAASALNHQNITTIFEIGESGDDLFIAMEYCEGRTLRQTIASGVLSVRRVLDIAVQACEGLAAAHEKGIVHRDIKSDNIMLTSGGQVKILDFGLAKFRGASKLTRTGSTLGTAAYMSPEQAQGEDVDARSDIFSFGIVLYEMLTGRPPFQGEHPAALAYAIVNEDPPPMGRFNPQVPVRLEEIVAKALAKDKQERYQHADDLLADLRRERKALEYAKAGQLVESTKAPVRGSGFGKRLVRWGIPAVMVVAIVIFMVVFNPFNLRIGSQQSVAAEHHSIAVMYFENVPDPADKDHTGEMLVNLMITSLSQAKGLDVISRERLYDIEREFNQGHEEKITPALATKIAERAGVKTMILGTILQSTPSLMVTSREVDVATGRILASQRLGGYSGSQVFTLIDSLSAEVLADLHVSSEAVADARPVAEVTTSSTEAYRSFVEGQDLRYKIYLPEAKASLQRAIDLDKNFAMAYYLMSDVQRNENDMRGSVKSLTKAWSLVDRVSDRERLLIKAAYLFWAKREYAEAAALEEELLQKYPHETWAVQDLVTACWFLGDTDRAQAVLSRGVAANPDDRGLLNEDAYVLTGLNSKSEAFRMADRYLRLAPGEPNPYDSKGEISLYFGERDSALIWWHRALALRADFLSSEKIGWTAMLNRDYAAAGGYFEQLSSTADPLQKLSAAVDRALMAAHQGRLRASRARIDSLLESVKRGKFSGPQLGVVYSPLIILSYEMADYPAMVRYAKEYSVISAGDPTDPIHCRDGVAWALLKNGEQAAFARTLDSLDKEASESGYGVKWEYNYLKGLIAYEEGNYGDALSYFGHPFSWLLPNHIPQYFYAVTLLKLGQTREAIQEFQRLTWCFPISFPPIGLPFLPTSTYWPIAAVKAHYWLGVAYEQEHDTAKAVEEFNEFLETWKHADRETPEMADAKARLEKLRQGAG